MSDHTHDPLPDDAFLDDDALVAGVPGRDWRALAHSPTPQPPPSPPLRRGAGAPAPRRWRSAQSVFLALAACLVVAMGLRVVYRKQHPGLSYHATATPLAIALPDGSHAMLEPGSYLGTNPGFPNGT